MFPAPDLPVTLSCPVPNPFKSSYQQLSHANCRWYSTYPDFNTASGHGIFDTRGNESKMKTEDESKPDNSANDRERNDRLNQTERDSGKRLPGEYPADEDIMNRQNTHRVGMDVENFSRMIGTENMNIEEPVVTNPQEIIEEPPALNKEDIEDQRDHAAVEHPIPKDVDNEDLNIQTTAESDVTEEDLQALGPKDLSMDMGEDEQTLKNRVWPVDMAGTDLDVPGSNAEQGDVNPPEDEENEFYSLGGDRHEDDMEGK